MIERPVELVMWVRINFGAFVTPKFPTMFAKFWIPYFHRVWHFQYHFLTSFLRSLRISSPVCALELILCSIIYIREYVLMFPSKIVG